MLPKNMSPTKKQLDHIKGSSENSSANHSGSELAGRNHEVELRAQSYEGPIPPPWVMREYNELHPGSVEIILTMATKEAEHRHEMERLTVSGNVSAQQRQIELAKQEIALNAKAEVLGVWLGALVALSFLVGACFLAMNGHENVAIAVGSGISIATVISAIIKAKSGQSKSKTPGN